MRAYVRAAVCALLTGLLLGCGGGRGEAPGGRATFRIRWPEPSRLLPAAARSVKIEVRDGAKVVGSAVIPRPETGNTTETTLGGLPVKTLVNTVTAHPFADGTGVAQARGTGNVAIREDEEVRVAIVLESTISRLEPLVPNPLRLGLDQGRLLGAVPQNAQGEMVLIRSGSLVFASSNPTALPVDANGLVRAVAEGTAQVTATEPESGVRFTWDVTALACRVPTPAASPCATVVGMPTAVQDGGRYTVTVIASDSEACRRPGVAPEDTRYAVYFPGATSWGQPNAYVRPGESQVTFTARRTPGDTTCYTGLSIYQHEFGGAWSSTYYAAWPL